MNRPKLINLAGAVALLLAAGATTAVLEPAAAPSPSSKATARVGEIRLVDGAQQLGWTTVLSSTLKTANKTDLLCNASLEAGLLTRSKVKGKERKRALSDALVKVRVLVDGELAYPGEVVFSRRQQRIDGVMAGDISGCLRVDELTGAVIVDEECAQPSEVEMLVNTMSANSFNFIYENCTAGEHTIEMQCMVGTSASVSDDTIVDAVATMGKGAFTVQTVRLANNDKIELD